MRVHAVNCISGDYVHAHLQQGLHGCTCHMIWAVGATAVNCCACHCPPLMLRFAGCVDAVGLHMGWLCGMCPHGAGRGRQICWRARACTHAAHNRADNSLEICMSACRGKLGMVNGLEINGRLLGVAMRMCRHSPCATHTVDPVRAPQDPDLHVICCK